LFVLTNLCSTKYKYNVVGSQSNHLFGGFQNFDHVSQDDPGQESHHKYKAVSQILFQLPSLGLSSKIAEFFSMY